MLIDRLMPEFDATRIEHRVVPGAVSDAYDAAVGIDFVDAVRQSQALRGLLVLRAQTERIALVLRRSGSAVPARGPEALRLADLPAQGERVRLGADQPNEIVFGAVGRFWAGETVWERIDASDFVAFARPGYAKIAANFSCRPYGAARTLVSYEARTRASDATARRAFWRYWRVTSPFVGRVMRTQLQSSNARRRDRGRATLYELANCRGRRARGAVHVSAATGRTPRSGMPLG